MSNYRSLFNLPESVCFLNSAFISPQLKSITEAGVKAVEFKEQPWRLKTSDFYTGCDELRDLVANLLGTSGNNVSLIPAVSYGVETAVRNLPLKPGQKVLIPAGDFPSNVYPWLAVCKQNGGVPTYVQRFPNHDWTTAFLEAIDETVAVVSVPQTDWSDGSHFDLIQISKKTKSVGAALVVDASQSFGVRPIDVQDFDPDFLFSVGYKWQLGPYGVSYMYVADRHLNGLPLENNWVNRRCDDFAKLTEYSGDFHEGARRFDSGQHSQFVLNPMAIEAMKLLNQIGPQKIFEHITSLNKTLTAGLENLGFEMIPENFRSGHMIGARAANGTCVKDHCAKLLEKNIFLSVRGNSLRISPHIYNSQEDIQKLLQALRLSTFGEMFV